MACRLVKMSYLPDEEGRASLSGKRCAREDTEGVVELGQAGLADSHEPDWHCELI